MVNGDESFPAMLTAIRGARTTITFANFSWEDGEVAREITEALAERCRAGFGVNVLVDAIGSRGMPKALGRMLAASGCHFARYGPAMLHAKTMVVDDQWVSIGSANLDNASFALNNELNVTFMDKRLARRLTEIFEQDLRSTTPVSLEEWRRHAHRHLMYLPLIPLRDQL